MGQYQSVLERLKSLEGLKGALIVSDKGEILESLPVSLDQLEGLVRLVSESRKSAESLGKELGKENAGQSYIEYDGLNITFDALSPKELLVIIAIPGANLGRIRYEIKQTKKLFLQVSG